MARNRRILAGLGAGTLVARELTEGTRAGAAWKAPTRVPPFGVGAARAHSNHPARSARFRSESGLRGKARVAEGLLAGQPGAGERQGVERKPRRVAKRSNGARALHD